METKKSMILSVKKDITKMLENEECKVVEFCRYDGTRIGIGNKDAKYTVIKRVIEILNEELEIMK